MKFTLAILFFVVVIIGGGILLQIFLSRRDSWWPGLILPGISLLFSLLAVLNVAVWDGMSVFQVIGQIAVVFLFSNIPTLVLLGIYFACREKLRRRAQLDKMNIQDLE